jgi:hypothetical protein
MDPDQVVRSFRESVSGQVRLESEGVDRFRVFTPFQFDDQDHLAIVLKRSNGSWVLSDEGHTYMHLTYEISEKDLQKGTRAKVISNALDSFEVQDRDGELVIPVSGERYGDALYNFVQALLRITDVSYLSRERVRSTFLEDFRAFMSEQIPEERRSFDWSHPIYDPAGNYVVDCRVNGMARPLMVFALPNDDRARDATIALLQFERWSLAARSLAIFEDQEQINRKVLARFSDTCEKQFSSLSANRDRIARFLEDVVAEEASSA